ncbi:PIN domain-containing protein [Duganella sp. FT80W]|uniref:PIN domain-containing protein n=1 Tax=Duganella guangzhouensis TaxID=2666084 RepID=A0A6I2L2P3_9BURK|nr:PIN domain-containing protein [Duganella guangzhouensis]MRW92418.1 PIN domain-containing protein [Duganella guangzhouensis]
MGLALFDSNIVMDALNGYPQAVAEISYFDDIAISSVAWVEVMSKPLAESARGKLDCDIVQTALNFLADFTIIHSNYAIMIEAARIRANSLLAPPKIRLPDVFILATANVTGRLLVTRNRRDFRGANVRFPYDLQDGLVFNVAPPPVG